MEYNNVDNLMQLQARNMAEGVIISELEKLESLLVEEFSHMSQFVKSEAEELIKELKLIVGLVRDKKPKEGRRLNYLISEVVKMARSAQRAMEDDDRTGLQLTKIRSMLNTTNTRFCELGVGFESDRVGDHAVGLEEDVELLLHKMWLGSNSASSSRGRCFVACIKGFGGTGKTTLARLLYNNADVVKKFEQRAWHNCKLCDTRTLLERIIGAVTKGQKGIINDNMQHASLWSLQKIIIRQLQGKRYLIVLDNFLMQHGMRQLMECFPDEDNGSTLLLVMNSSSQIDKSFVGYFHDMKPLDLDKSWQLLRKTIFSGNNNGADQFPKQLERKGKEKLMKHTGGVPLAIEDVGKEWAEKRRLGSEWEEVVESDDLELKASLEALEFSYRNFYPDVKLCFLHLAFFKEGTTIKVEKLVQTLIAARVLEYNEEEEYRTRLGDLIEQNIIEVQDRVEGRQTKYCRVRPIFHKLSIKKVKEGYDHRVIYCSRERFNCPTDEDGGLVCLSFNGGGCLDSSPTYWKCFEKLRVIDFEGFGLKFLPETVGELIELRYLGLRNNYLQELPHSLGRLVYLEVLDIAFNFMVEVPDIIWEMDALCHLYMSDIICEKPLKIEVLKNLKTLTYVSADNWTNKMPGSQMISLRKLGIEELDENSDVSKLFASLAMLSKLKCLVLRGFRFRSMPSLDKLGVLGWLNELKLDGLITELPNNFPRRLRSLTLVNSCLHEDPMPVLEELPHLKYLKLKNAYTGHEMVISLRGFQVLNHLCIKELSCLRNIQVGQYALGSLKILEISSCPRLHTLPKRIITKVMKLNMVTTRNVVTKIKNSGLFSNLPNVDMHP